MQWSRFTMPSHIKTILLTCNSPCLCTTCKTVLLMCNYNASCMWLPAPLNHISSLSPHLLLLAPPINFLWCYLTTISIFTTIIHWAMLILLPFLACIAVNTSLVGQGTPDTCRQSMPMLFIQMDSDLKIYLSLHHYHQLNPQPTIHLQMSPSTLMKCPTLHHHFLLPHCLLHLMIWTLIIPMSTWIIYHQCPILILNQKYTDSLHREIR